MVGESKAAIGSKSAIRVLPETAEVAATEVALDMMLRKTLLENCRSEGQQRSEPMLEEWNDKASRTADSSIETV